MTKAELHQLVDELPDDSLDAAATMLRRARDPAIARLEAAPYDDEPFTEADRDAVREARQEPRVPWTGRAAG
jgi:hypothetical protein